MKKNVLSLLSLVLIFAGLVACNDDEKVAESATSTDEECLSGSSKSAGEIIPGEYIITIDNTKSGSGRAVQMESLLDALTIRRESIVKKMEGKSDYYLMKLTETEARQLEEESAVTVEPDRTISICGCFSVQEPRSVTWNVDKVGFGDGTGKTAWIIDTGIDADHPDLVVDKNRSKSFLDAASYEDDNGHGTHVGGVIGARNNNIGTLGVASGASLVALKVLDKNGDGKLSGLLSALSYVRKNGKAGDVVNISIGFVETSATLENEIKSIAARGIYFALAAGNESMEANGYSPAQIGGDNIYTVSAIDSLDRFASFSNYGNDVIDYAAPGVRILSSYTEGRYAILSGTSMASPHVAGLLLVNNGKLNSKGFAISDPDGVGDPIVHK